MYFPRCWSMFIIPVCIILLTGCKPETETGTLPELHLIPQPTKVIPSTEVFTLADGGLSAPQALSFEATLLAKLVRENTAVNLFIGKEEEPKAPFRMVLDTSMVGDEAYQLEITPMQVTMRARTPAGIFYAVQTFRQFLPLEVPSKNAVASIPCVSIQDAPRFPYRGMHLDVSRHFFDVPVIKKYLDVLARYKFNYFHWHLTDDQGWRIPIDAYPKLNTIASWRDETLIGNHNAKPWRFDGKRHGGFYTKDQIREVVNYAAHRHITIIPEIEMPGHSQAVLAAYPEFGCTQKKLNVRNVWGVSEDVLCPKEETFKFLEEVLSEVIDLFPGMYIHIGGDECPKIQWKESTFCQDLIRQEGLADEHELQSWFVQRIERFINSNGRKMIGWDEILEGGLAPNAVVMSWRGITGGIEAAKQDHDVIMTPTSHVYFDYYQSTHPEEPLAIGGYLPLTKVYAFEPVPEELTPDQREHILGAQGNVWTEYIETPLKLDYMAWPRGQALAEVLWSSTEQRNFTDFAERLEPHLDALRKDGIYAANHLYELDYTTFIKNGQLFLRIDKILPDIIVNYSTDGEKTWTSTASPLLIDSSMTLIARAESDKGFRGQPLQMILDKHIAAGKSITLATDPASQYNNGGVQSLINGIKGSDTRYGDKEWRGFSGTDLEATIDLGTVKDVSSVETRFYSGPGQWIHLPGKAVVSFSQDGSTYSREEEMEQVEKTDKIGTTGPHIYRASISPAMARFIKVVATNFGKIPNGMPGAGNEAWLFVDEVVVR